MKSGITIAAICARGGSRGVPRKALRRLAGKTLIRHAVECAENCRVFDDIIVSTDDVGIAEEARICGATVPFMRPAELADDTAPKWDVFRHLTSEIRRIHHREISILVDLDVCVPLRRPETVRSCLELLRTTDSDLVVTAYPSDRNPYFNMVEIRSDGFVELVKKSASPVHNRQQAPRVFSLSPAVYAIRTQCLQTLDHWSSAKMRIVEISREEAWDIDSELDFKIVNLLAKERFNAG